MWEKTKKFLTDNSYWLWDVVMIIAAIDIGIRYSSGLVSIFFYIINCIVNTLIYVFFYINIKDFITKDPREISERFRENFTKLIPEYSISLMFVYSIFVFVLH